MTSNQPSAPPEQKTLTAGLTDFLQSKQKGNDSGNYAREADRIVSHWIDWLDDTYSITTFDGLTTRHLGEYARELKRRAHAGEISGRTAHTYWGVLRAYLTYAKKWGYIAENPAAKQRVLDELPEQSKGTNGQSQQFWSAKERAQLTRYADERAHTAIDEQGFAAVEEVRDRALVYLLAYTGARVSELVRDPNDERRDGIRWRDLNLDEGTLTVLGKSQDEEEVQLPKQTYPALKRYRQVLDPPHDDWPVFPTQHPPTLHKRAQSALTNAGVDDVETRLQNADPSNVLREYDCPPPNITAESVRTILQRLCEEGDIDVEGDHDYLKPHGARRGVGEVLYREKGHSAAQRALRHADPSTTSEMYSHIEASELATEVGEAFEEVDK